jgi:hypothetical protein
MAEEDKKKPGEGGPDETTLQVEQRDPDEMVFAEQAIHHYVSDVIERFVDEAESAFSMVNSHLGALEEMHLLNNMPILEGLASEMAQEVLGIFGGAESPIAHALSNDLFRAAGQAARGGQVLGMVHEMGYAVRDAAWFVRDNLQSVLAGEWDELRDLAYEGETMFIPLLHSLGVPAVELTAQDIAQELIDEIDETVEKLPREAAEVKLDEASVVTPEAKEEEQVVQQELMEEEEQKEEIA